MKTTRKAPIKYRRGKPTPVIRHGDIVDLKTWPLGSKPDGRPIRLCPACGWKGEFSAYSQQGKAPRLESYVHLKRFETIFWMVLDSCNVTPE